MLVLFIINTLQVMTLGILLPITPLIREVFNISYAELGYVFSLFGLSAFISNMVIGILSDKFGRKICLVIPLFLVSIVYILQAYTTVFTNFLIYRGISGLLIGSFAVCYAAASNMSTSENRLKYMGIIGASLGIGFSVGPLFGGIISAFGDGGFGTISLMFKASAALTFTACLISLFLFKDPLTKELKESNKQPIGSQIKDFFKDKEGVMLLVITISFTSLITGSQTYMMVWLSEIFAFSTPYIAVYISTSAFIMALSQGFILRLFSNAKTALITGLTVYALANFAFIFTNVIVVLVIVSVIAFTALGFIIPSIQTRLSIKGEPNQQGFVYGMNQSLTNLGRMIGPILIGAIYQIHYNFYWLFIAIACVLIAAIAYVFLQK